MMMVYSLLVYAFSVYDDASDAAAFASDAAANNS